MVECIGGGFGRLKIILWFAIVVRQRWLFYIDSYFCIIMRSVISDVGVELGYQDPVLFPTEFICANCCCSGVSVSVSRIGTDGNSKTDTKPVTICNQYGDVTSPKTCGGVSRVVGWGVSSHIWHWRDSKRAWCALCRAHFEEGNAKIGLIHHLRMQ